MTTPDISTDYNNFLHDLKHRIRSARTRAALAANRELVLLYWQIGRDILERQEQEGWGAKIVERLARDLRAEFPDMKGFSPRNMLFMRAFAEAYTDETIVKQLVSQLPWGHVVRLIQKVKSPEEREWYIRKTLEHGWSRDILVMQIESRLFHRQGKAINNFAATLPPLQSDLASQVSAVDATMRHEGDNPSIGLILCKDRKGLIAEYALKDISKPVGVSEYQLLSAIPEELKGSLPTIEELEAELADKLP